MPEPTTTGDRSGALRGALTLLLAVLLLASVGFAVAAATGVVGDDDADAPQTRRDAVMLAARQYVEAASNYGPSDLDEQNLLTGYRDRVRPLISSSYSPAFEQSVENLSPLVVQGFAVRTTVDRVAVESLGEDRAVVLVSGETARSVQDRTEQPQGYTLAVPLVLVDDAWLVDAGPTEVTAEQQGDAPAGSDEPGSDEPDSDEPDSDEPGKRSGGKGGQQ